jgi:LysR family transcriptional regulator, benzoate and cis,cis-muconate-responsive activator of ben and cat genes
MEMRHLRYFVAVAEDFSFRRAAHRLHLSHPSLSQQITNLENELGIKLFKRNSRQVELTEPGRVFLAGVRQTLKSIQKAVAQAQEVAKGERGRLVIGNIGLLTQNFLPTALAHFRQRYPLVEVTVNHMNSHTQAEALLDGSIMLGVGYVDAGVDEEDRELLATELLLKCPYGIVYSKHRRFPKRRTPALTDFRHDTFLAFAPQLSPVHAHWTRELCQETGGFESKVEAIANSREDMTSMVAAGRGVWLAPEIAVPTRLEAVNYQRLEEIEPKYELFLVSKKEAALPATVEQFIRVLKDCTNSETAALAISPSPPSVK